jgi:hypothetical protein
MCIDCNKTMYPSEKVVILSFLHSFPPSISHLSQFIICLELDTRFFSLNWSTLVNEIIASQIDEDGLQK